MGSASRMSCRLISRRMVGFTASRGRLGCDMSIGKGKRRYMDHVHVLILGHWDRGGGKRDLCCEQKGLFVRRL